MGDKKIRVEAYSMNEDMKLRAQEYVMSLLSQEKNKSLELEIAKGLKKEFDTKFHPTWQCIVGKEYKELRKDLTLIIGKNFGSDVGFEDKHFIYFYMGSIAILLWKAG